jgi:hypothetical protein
MTDELIEYAVALARPSCCEVQLQRFLRSCEERGAKTQQEVASIFREMRTVSKEGQRGNRRPKIVTGAVGRVQ